MNVISDLELQQIRTQMLTFAQLQVNQADLAEDLVQEAFLSAFKNLANFKRQSAFKTWIFAILKNKIIDYLRQKGRFVLESELEDENTNNSFFDEKGHWKPEYHPSELQGEEETVYSDEFWLIFETCLTCLPAKQAKIFMMREFLELSSEEICQETHLTSSNLHTTLYRARLQLQNCLSKKTLGENYALSPSHSNDFRIARTFIRYTRKSWVKSSFSYLPTLSSFSKKLQNLKRDDEAI